MTKISLKVAIEVFTQRDVLKQTKIIKNMHNKLQYIHIKLATEMFTIVVPYYIISILLYLKFCHRRRIYKEAKANYRRCFLGE